jgi:hypothetical protein
MKPKVTLRDFWSSSSIGHLNFYREDFTKFFLLNIAQNFSIPNDIYIDSNFKRKSILKKVSNKLTSLNKMESKQRIAYGYDLSLTRNKNSKYIWYTPENIRPPLHLNYDAFLSHDLEDYGGRNIYLPFWATRLSKTINGAKDYQSVLLRNRSTDIKPRKFACAVISNPDPIRLEFIKLLSSYGKIDIFGKLGKSIDNKMKVLEEYRFNICFENSLFPGYVTEKPLESWLSGCIPVWYGLDVAGFLNTRAIINVAELGFQKSIEEIVKIDTGYSNINSIIGEPFLKKGFDFDALSMSISKLLKG